MARAINRLSARTVATLKEAGYHADGGGLYLQITASGAKSWIFQYKRNGRSREMGLGSLLAITLADARTEAQAARRLRAEGKDPITERDARRAAELKVPTFKKAAEDYIESQRAGWTNPKHVDQWTNTLNTYAYPVIGEMRVNEIDTAHILEILNPIWTTKTETASRVRQRIEQVLDSCAAKKLCSRENPARWRGHLDKLLPPPSRVRKVKHHAAMPYVDLPTFMQELKLRPGVDARALEWTILTACRTSETIKAEPSEDRGDQWSIPADRTKSKRIHNVPLVAQARAILDGPPSKSKSHLFVKKNGKPLSSAAMDALLDRMGYGHLTVHGFRSSFKDWAAETTSFPNIVSEAALGHVIKDDTEAAYRRGELMVWRRRLMAAWADYLYGDPSALEPL